MKRAHTSCSSDSPTLYPHVFISAAMAFQQLRTNGKNQSVLISGESGGENISIPDFFARIYLQIFLIWLSELRLFAYETPNVYEYVILQLVKLRRQRKFWHSWRM
jgi:hypothetical protein